MRNKYHGNPFMVIAIIVALFGTASLMYTNWGTEGTRSVVAVFMMFWNVSVGYFIREGCV